MEKPQQIKGCAIDSAQDRASSCKNGTGTYQKIGTPLTQRRSGPVRFELLAADGDIFGPFATLDQVVKAAGSMWPEQEQDADRQIGWDVQVVGA